MLKTGQPLHAFDYDKFLAVGGEKSPEITIRLARPGESLVLLDEKEIKLNDTDIIITSSDTPVALAGAMGGLSTAIDDSTKKIIVEIASFSLYNLRRTQMSHGLFSEAITRFTKGRPATDLAPAAELALSGFRTLGGKLTARAFSGDKKLYQGTSAEKIILTASDVNALLGSDYSSELMQKTLENVGFTVKITNDILTVLAPAWRSDIKIKEDIVEEVGRLLGYDTIPLAFPSRPFVAPSLDPMLSLKKRLRALLSDRLGANEILTYSFVSEKILAASGLSSKEIEDTYKIVNSISPDLERFRPALLPSLLSKLPENLKAGFRDFSLFELNQVSAKSLGLDPDCVPNLETHLALTVFGDFYAIKSRLIALATSLNLSFTFRPLPSSSTFEPKHSAEIYFNDTKLGLLGELNMSVLKNFKLSGADPLSALEIALEPLISAPSSTSTSVANRTKTERISSADENSPKTIENPSLPEPFPFYRTKFQTVTRDLTIKTEKSVPFSDLERIINDTLNGELNLLYTLEPLSVFSKSADSKNTSFRLTLGSLEKTFESTAVSDIIEKITKNLSALGAEVV